jgi:hypothetical protein
MLSGKIKLGGLPTMLIDPLGRYHPEKEWRDFLAALEGIPSLPIT